MKKCNSWKHSFFTVSKVHIYIDNKIIWFYICDSFFAYYHAHHIFYSPYACLNSFAHKQTGPGKVEDRFKGSKSWIYIHKGPRETSGNESHTNSVRNACLLRPSSAVNADSSTRERYATTLAKRKENINQFQTHHGKSNEFFNYCYRCRPYLFYKMEPPLKDKHTWKTNLKFIIITKQIYFNMWRKW